jgi:DNA/RNA endonuclease YhcR with UshA esterase domain
MQAVRCAVVISIISILAGPALAAETVAPCDAGNHVGQTVTIAGGVTDVHHAASGSTIFVNMGGVFPKNCFSAVIFKTDFAKFSDVDSLRGKNVEVSGAVRLYQNKPEMILNDPGQLKTR